MSNANDYKTVQQIGRVEIRSKPIVPVVKQADIVVPKGKIAKGNLYSSAARSQENDPNISVTADVNQRGNKAPHISDKQRH